MKDRRHRTQADTAAATRRRPPAFPSRPGARQADPALLARLVGNRAARRAVRAFEVRRARAAGLAATTAPDAAASQINTWIGANPPPGQAANYCTGVLDNGDLIVSKVNGVTSATAYTGLIGAFITGAGLHNGRDIYLAQKFNTSVGSNHAEMCIVAAAKAMGRTVVKIYCSGPHCGFCKTFMTKAGITLGAAAGSEDQMGWAHPHAPLSYGQQLETSVAEQKAELANLAVVPTKAAYDGLESPKGTWGFTAPEGKYTAWL